MRSHVCAGCTFTLAVNNRAGRRPVGQMRRLVSQLALTRRAPSGLTAMPVTASVCSLHVAGNCHSYTKLI